MDEISESRLKQVHPLLAQKVRQMAKILDGRGITIRVTQGLRTWEEQEALYAKGRTENGVKVTNAPPGFSYHNFGLAVDVVPMTKAGPDWNRNHPVWKDIIIAGKEAGLDAGAEWRTFPDYPHFQLTGALPISPNSEVRSQFAKGGIRAVWQSTGLVPPEEEVEA